MPLVDALGQEATPGEILGLMRLMRANPAFFGIDPITTEFESALRELPVAYPEKASDFIDMLNRSEDEQDREAVSRYFVEPPASH